jgi:hypothetical protein
MADVEWRDEGLPEMIQEIFSQSVEAAKNAVDDAAGHLRESILITLSGQRTGIRYPVPGTSQATYQASAPGEPPAVMVGNLRKSISASPATVDGDVVWSAVGPDEKVVPYARRLEYGGTSMARNGRPVYIAPRPYLRPTFIEQQSAMENILIRGAGAR